MEFNFRYFGHSGVEDSTSSTALNFAPDTLREPAYFTGTLNAHLPFREAISALNAVVVSDLRTQPKDRTEYRQWLEQHELALLADFLTQRESVDSRLQTVRAELEQLRRESEQVLKPYHRAQEKYFRYLYTMDRDAWFVLDPVITVHPDEVFFECFSQDESSYARLACQHDSFDRVGEMAFGTTNIDYSESLYTEFQKIRSYKSTELRIDPSGFAVQTSQEAEYIEQKIDLPDSWVRGFLQVSSAMTLDAVHFELHPMDMHACLTLLKRKRESHGPRSIRFSLTPGQPIRARFEPWNTDILFRRSVYAGTEPREVRIWGRRRLLTLERLIAHARKFDVYLLGSGLPSFFVADLGLLTFTLGLSGWTANDWSRLGNFDLMTPRAEVDEFTANRVFTALGETHAESATTLAARLGLEKAIVDSALARYVQAGRAMYDLGGKVYRLRELSREPLPLATLRFANEREARAARFVAADLVKNLEAAESDDALRLQGDMLDNARKISATAVIDTDQRLVSATCSCAFFHQHRLRRGPCEHVLALRLEHSSRAH